MGMPSISTKCSAVCPPGNRMQDTPITLLREFLGLHPEVVECELGIYKYTPQSVQDTRRLVKCSPAMLAAAFTDSLKVLGHGEELAVHSRLTTADGSKRHMGFADFLGTLSKTQVEIFTKLAQEFGSDLTAVFRTGRSFHGYALALLSNDEWVHFLSRLLLLNSPAEPHWIDCRWVGHGLLGGFSSLRISHNTDMYLRPPILAVPGVLRHDGASSNRRRSPRLSRSE